MKVGIIGSGGREHAICLSIKQSTKVEKIYCFPGNAGTSKIAQNVEIDISNFKAGFGGDTKSYLDIKLNCSSK